MDATGIPVGSDLSSVMSVSTLALLFAGILVIAMILFVARMLSMRSRLKGVSVRVMHGGKLNDSVKRALESYGAKIRDDASNILFITEEKTDETEEDDNSITRKIKVRLRISIEREIGVGEVFREDVLTDNIHLTGPHIVAMLERWGGTVLTFKRHK